MPQQICRRPTVRFDRLAPPLFVVLWSTGWIVVRYSAEYAELLAMARMSGARFPRRRRDFGHALVGGMLLRGFYLGGA